MNFKVMTGRSIIAAWIHPLQIYEPRIYTRWVRKVDDNKTELKSVSELWKGKSGLHLFAKICTLIVPTNLWKREKNVWFSQFCPVPSFFPPTVLTLKKMDFWSIKTPKLNVLWRRIFEMACVKFFQKLRGCGVSQILIQNDQCHQPHHLLIDLNTHMLRYWPCYKNYHETFS